MLSCQNKNRPLICRPLMEAHMEFKKRSDLHLARKFWHVITVFLMFLVYHYLPPFWSGVVLILACLIFVPFDFIRKKVPALNQMAMQVFGPIVRQNEVNGIAGTTYLLIGVLVVYLFFPRTIVLMTLLYLAFADPIASFVGIKYGKDKLFRNKSLQGSAAAFFVCAGLYICFLQYKRHHVGSYFSDQYFRWGYRLCRRGHSCREIG